jgi:uridine kinase
MKNIGPGIYGLTGGAGAGKTTLAKNLKSFCDEISIYSADFRFIGGSEERKQLLKFKQGLSIESYVDVCNQYNWWDWDAIENDLRILKSGGNVTITKPYDRDKGSFDNEIVIDGSKPYIIYEGNNIGSPAIIELLSLVFILNTRDDIRFQRLYQKDLDRRTLKEIMARFLITEYSENLSYRLLEKWYWGKVKVVSEAGYIFPGYNMGYFASTVDFVPLRMGG